MIIRLLLEGRKVVVIGSKEEASARLEALAAQGARASHILPPQNPHSWRWRYRVAKALRGAFLVIATDRDRTINEWLWSQEESMGFLLNTLDEKETCNFYHLATREPYDGITIAVSTNGASPRFASRLATKLASSVDAEDISIFESFRRVRIEARQHGISSFDLDWDAIEANTHTLGSSKSA